MSTNESMKTAGQEMWGGRFAAKPSQTMQRINASIGVDQRLWREDIEGSKAHAAMLAAQQIITRKDADAIIAGLDAIAADIVAGRFEFSEALEDIHLNIEARLTERIGEAGKRLHTARSRNDQVATDFKLWTGRACEGAAEAVAALQRVLVDRAADAADWVMPGFTHLQTAQPVTLGHHLLAYVEMLERDQMRLLGASGAALEGCPLGAAALAGTGFAIDRTYTAQTLGFSEPAANSMDAVGSRDFALQALSAASIAGVTLSRLAEEIVLWTSPQFGFARLADDWSTGSSIMPQKRNPDAAELIRAKTKRISANLAALTAIMAGLPLTYAKDMQDDKALTFEAFDALDLCLGAMTGMMATIQFDRVVLAGAADRGFSTATDLADWLVRTLNMPFREAHHVTGAVVKSAEARGLTSLRTLPLAELQAIEPRITEDARRLLDVAASVDSRSSVGGTAPAQVRAQIARWRAVFAASSEQESEA